MTLFGTGEVKASSGRLIAPMRMNGDPLTARKGEFRWPRWGAMGLV
jgi:hypothetical protein